MQSWTTFGKLTAAMMLAAGMAACGGGGGGGDGGSGTGTGTGTGSGSGSGTGTTGDASTPPAVESTLKVALNGTPSLKIERLQGNPGAALALDILATGAKQDWPSTVYVVIEDPASLFESTPEVRLHANPDGAFVTLRPRVLDVPGHFTGDLQVHVCKEAECRTEFAGSPLRVPYDVTVRRGVNLAQETINLTLPFGQEPPDQTVTTTLPEQMLDWQVVKSTVLDLTSPATGALMSSATSEDRATGTVTFKIRPGLPGVHLDTYDVMGYSRLSDGTFASSRKTISLRYTVTPDPSVLYVFSPSEGQYTVGPSETGRFIPNPLVSYTVTQLRGVEYLSQPDAAAGHPLANGWFSTFDFRIEACTSVPGGMNCLPPGTYQARLRYSVAVGTGSQRDVFWPLTVQVLPR